MKLSLDLIAPAPHPVRTTWDEDKLNELAQSIRENGVIVPIKVRPVDGGYEVVYGHRRAEAARRAGMTEIEASVDGLDDQHSLIEALIENVQREDISALDTARGLKALKDATGWSLGEIERRGIMTDSSASRLLALLKESEPVQRLLDASHSGRAEPSITPRHVTAAREVLSVPAEKVAVLEKAAKEGLTAAQTRRVAESVAAAPSPQAKERLMEWEYDPFTHNPERIRQRAQHHGGAHDPMYRDNRPSPEQVWRETVEVKQMKDDLKRWSVELAEMKKAVKVPNKVPVETRPFFAQRVTTFAHALLQWASELEAGE